MKIPVPPELTPVKVTVIDTALPFPLTKDSLGAKIEGMDVVTTITILRVGVRGVPIVDVGPGDAFSRHLPGKTVGIFTVDASEPLLMTTVTDAGPPEGDVVIKSTGRTVAP